MQKTFLCLFKIYVLSGCICIINDGWSVAVNDRLKYSFRCFGRCFIFQPVVGIFSCCMDVGGYEHANPVYTPGYPFSPEAQLISVYPLLSSQTIGVSPFFTQLKRSSYMRYLLLMSVLLVPFTAYGAGMNVTYEVNGKSYEGYYVNAGKESPLVLLLHDWDGLTDYEMKRAEMLSELGYTVFAADLFGAGVRPTEVVDKRQHTGELYSDREKMRALLNGAVATAAEQGANITNSVVFGYCFGGAAVLEMARAGADMKGFVSFHGGLTTPAGQDYSRTKGDMLILHGTADSNITMEHFAALATELENAKVSHEMTTYSGAPHAFTVFGSESYREDADRKSWSRFLHFLEETLK
jgi:dienelactone hydrolase